jgi:ribonucleoside-triphosphate reductase
LVVTLNLVDIACSSYGDEDEFWKIFDERLKLCYRALMARHKRLEGTPSDVAPILWQYGAYARLEKGEVIDKLLHGGYSTISLGYAGLYECVYRMKGVSHTEPEVGKPFALKIMQKMNDACAEWKEKENIDFSIYGTPLESTTYKFAKCLKERFGVIEHAFSKLGFEAEFQHLSPGGAISYVEVPNLQDNIPAVLTVIQYIYDNIIYAEINTKSDYCQVCGYDGEIMIVEDENKKLVWECPNCKNRDQNKMNVTRRTCGLTQPR